MTLSHLEDHDFAIISLQVESPGGGDETLGGADDVIAPAGHSIHHRHRLRPVGHGLQLQEDTRDNQNRKKLQTIGTVTKYSD